MNQKIRIGPITVGVSGLLFCLSCGIPLRRDGTGVEPRIAGGEIRAILLAELRQRAVIHPTPDSSNTRFVDDSSAVAPGMMYHWGIYSPPLRPEVHFTALVAERNGALLLISMPSDLEVGGFGFWRRLPRPKSRDESGSGARRTKRAASGAGVYALR